MNNATNSFFSALISNGHNGDTMCLATISEKLALGVKVAYSHYAKYLSHTTLATLTPAQIIATVKSGKKVWTVEGMITPNKGNALPVLNGKIVMSSDLVNLAKNQVIIL